MGYKLKDIRKRMSISQAELSKKSGVSRTTISGIESGRVSVITTGTLKRLAKSLGVSITDIFIS